MSTQQPPADAGSADAQLKARHRSMWASGDYPSMVETFLLPLGPRLVEACGIAPGMRVLDVGAGTGNASIAAALAGAAVTASDLTPELLEAGRARADAQGARLDWVEADAERLPFGDASFDVVMSSIGAMFAPHHQAVADELVRVCRPGGTVGLLSWTPEGMIGALFRTMGPFAPAPPPGAQPPPLWGSEGHLDELSGRASGSARSSATSWRSRPSRARATSASTSRRATARRSPRAPTRARRARHGVRRGAGPVLRRVGRGDAGAGALRHGVPARDRHARLREPVGRAPRLAADVHRAGRCAVRAVVMRETGGPEVLREEEVPGPSPARARC